MQANRLYLCKVIDCNCLGESTSVQAKRLAGGTNGFHEGRYGSNSQLRYLFTVEIFPPSTCLIPNVSVSLPHRRGNTVSLETNLSVTIKLTLQLKDHNSCRSIWEPYEELDELVLKVVMFLLAHNGSRTTKFLTALMALISPGSVIPALSRLVNVLAR